METLQSRWLRLEPFNEVLILLVVLLISLICGLFVAQLAVTGAVIVVGLLVLPLVAAVEGAPIVVFLVLYPLVWPWTFAGVGAEHAVGLYCIIAWVLGLLMRRQPIHFVASPASYLILTFFVFGLLSIALLTISRSDYLFRIYALNAALFVMAAGISTTVASVKRSLQAIVIGTVSAGFIAFLGFIQGQVIESQGLSRLGLEGVGVNNFASILLLGSAVAIGLAIGEQRKQQLLMYWLAGLFLTFLIILSQSRGAFAGQILLVMVGVAFTNRSRRGLLLPAFALLGMAFTLVGGGMSGALADYSARMGNLLSGGSALEVSRPYLWKMGLQGFVDNPLFGIGVGNFTEPTNWFTLAAKTSAPRFIFSLADIHSFYIGPLVELGLVGFVPFIGGIALIGLGIARIAWRVPDIGVPALAGPAYALLFGCATFFAAIALLPAGTLAMPYVLLGLSEGFRHAVWREHAATGTQATEA